MLCFALPFKGGKPAAEFTTKNYLMYFANILAMNEHDSLKLVRNELNEKYPKHKTLIPHFQQVLKSLCEICGASSLTQDFARYLSSA